MLSLSCLKEIRIQPASAVGRNDQGGQPLMDDPDVWRVACLWRFPDDGPKVDCLASHNGRFSCHRHPQTTDWGWHWICEEGDILGGLFNLLSWPCLCRFCVFHCFCLSFSLSFFLYLCLYIFFSLSVLRHRKTGFISTYEKEKNTFSLYINIWKRKNAFNLDFDIAVDGSRLCSWRPVPQAACPLTISYVCWVTSRAR